LKPDPVFNKLFMEAELSNYSEEQAEAYYASKKDEWDRFAIQETAMHEGERKGKLAIALQMKLANEPMDKIMLYTSLALSQIEQLH
jgi:hypothetical protein